MDDELVVNMTVREALNFLIESSQDAAQVASAQRLAQALDASEMLSTLFSRIKGKWLISQGLTDDEARACSLSSAAKFVTVALLDCDWFDNVAGIKVSFDRIQAIAREFKAVHGVE